MFCKNCGKSISDASQFCPYCGTKVAAASSMEPAAESQETQDSYDQVFDYGDIEATQILSESRVRKNTDAGAFSKEQKPAYGQDGPHYSAAAGTQSTGSSGTGNAGAYSYGGASQYGYGAAGNAQSGYGATGNTQPGYGAAGNAQSGYGAAGNTQSGYGAAGNTQSGYGAVGNAQSGYGAAGNTQPGYGAAGNTQSGYGAAGNTQSGYGAAGNTQSGYGAAGNTQSGYGAAGNAQSGYGYGAAGNTQSGYGAAGNTQPGYGAPGNTQAGYNGAGGQSTYGAGGYTQGYNTYNNGGAYAGAASVNNGAAGIKPKKKLGKGGIIGICAGGGAVLIAIIIVCVVMFSGRSSYETPLKKLFSAMNSGDVMEMMEAMPLKLIVEEGGMSSYFMGMDYEDILEMYAGEMDADDLMGLSEEFGDDYKAEYKIYSAEPLSAVELSDLNREYASYFGTDDDFIDEAMELNVDLIINGSLDSDVVNEDIIVVKIDGKWYMDMFSME